MYPVSVKCSPLNGLEETFYTRISTSLLLLLLLFLLLFCLFVCFLNQNKLQNKTLLGMTTWSPNRRINVFLPFVMERLQF